LACAALAMCLQIKQGIMFCLRTNICFVLKHFVTLFQINYEIYKLI